MSDMLTTALKKQPEEITYCIDCGHRSESGYCEIIHAHTPDSEFCKDGTKSESARMRAE